MNAASPSTRPGPTRVVAIVGLALALSITLPPLSSTRLQTWPFAAAAAAFWALPLVVACIRFALGRPDARLGGLLDIAFAGLALAGLAATAASPLRATLLPHLLPFLGALALPYALLPVFREKLENGLSLVFILPLILAASILWQLAPTDFASPHVRNNQPFGHANTTGSVFALGACWLGSLAWRTASRQARLVFAGTALLCATHVVASGSRGAMIGLAGALVVAGGVVLLRHGRVVAFLVCCALVGTGLLVASPRLREAALGGGWSKADRGSNRERVAMIRGGLALFAERPVLGWGPGAVPHVFPGVRAPLPGTPDNYLQLHNTPMQLVTTLGAAGAITVGLLLLALLRRLREPAQAPLAATLACAGLVLVFDHPLPVPAFALLAALPVAALGAASAGRAGPARRSRAWAALPALGLAFVLPAVGRDLSARSAWSAALDSAAAGDPAAYAAALRRARDLAPADPFYADQLASHLATGHPFPGRQSPDIAAAVPLLRETIERNPRHEFARYNLAWLLLADPAGDAAEAREQFAASARLAPARREVYLGLALSRIRSSDADLAVAALAAEILLDPSFACSPRWRDPEIAPLRERALAYAADFLADAPPSTLLLSWLREPEEPAEMLSAYRRVRTGHGVLYGHPDGPPPADVNILVRFRPPLGLRRAARDARVAPADLLDCAGLAP